MMSVLEIKNVIKRYGSKVVLNDINLKIDAGKIVGLLGPNGCGKTTLIKMIAGLLTPTNGEILVCDESIGVKTKAIVSYLPDRPYFGGWMKVRDILEFFADFYRDFDMKRALEMLELLKIKPSERIKTMSKGTKEKLELILVMSRNARLYLLDEPIGGVDPATRDYILKTIISNYNEDSSIIITTHHIADVEKILDDVIFLSSGKIELLSAVDELREERCKSVDEIFREAYKC